MKEKFLSRKFLMAFASFLASLGTYISGISSGNEKIAMVGIICTVASAAIYAGCEAYVDAAHCNDGVVIEEDDPDE